MKRQKNIILQAVVLCFMAMSIFPAKAQDIINLGDTLVLELDNFRGNIQWQESTDSIAWVDIPGADYQPYFLQPTTTKYYRAMVTEGTCDAIYTEAEKIIVNLGLDAPVEGTHIPSVDEIIWIWNPVVDADGYKWNTTDEYGSAIDVGTDTSFTEADLTCDSTYTRYIWAYSSSSVSESTEISVSTQACEQTDCGIITDIRDGKTYQTVVIGNQCWMAENLNYGNRINTDVEQSDNSAAEKWCYDNLEANCDTLGALYQWGELVQYLNGAGNNTSWDPLPTGPIQGVCPDGWLIPSDEDIGELMVYMENNDMHWCGGSAANTAKALASTQGWNTSTETCAIGNNQALNNSSGFNAKPAGRIHDGSSGFKGAWSPFWSSREESGPGSAIIMEMGTGFVAPQIDMYDKTYGFSVRCIKDNSTPTPPSTPVEGTHIPSTDQIIWKWHHASGADGYKWNTIDEYGGANDLGLDTFIVNSGLDMGTTYNMYVWAYNNHGTSDVLTLTATTLNTGDVFSPATGKIWMDKNLGASQVATSSNDADAYGDLYQWGRGTDGHQIRTSSTDGTPSGNDIVGHGDFITDDDWRSPQNDNLWQGIDGVNNPCPAGFRVPTEAEWAEERLSWSSDDAAGAYASPLKLTVGGGRSANHGNLFSVGTQGGYWSSTTDSPSSRNIFFGPSSLEVFSSVRGEGYSVRCIKE